MRPVLRGVSLALASCLSLLASDARADPEPVPEYGVEPIAEPVLEPIVEPAKALMVSGVVEDAQGEAIKGVEVSLSGQTTTTDGRGEYALFWPVQCATPCEVVFSHKEYAQARVPLAPEDGPVQRQADAVLEKR